MRLPRPSPTLLPALLTPLLCGAFAACVPPGNATPDDAGPAANATPVATLPKPPPNVLTTVFEDTFDRPEGGPNADLKLNANGPWGKQQGLASIGADGSTEQADGGTGSSGSGTSPPPGDGGASLFGANGFGMGPDGGRVRRFVETLPDGSLVVRTVPAPMDKPPPAPEPDKSNLGPNWVQAQTNAWHIEDGWLCVENAHNHGVWFSRPIPVNARIEFDAKSDSPEGDLKAELWGDGRGFAKGNSYNDATSYLAILGGWKNTLHVLARLDEHKEDRKTIRVDKDSDDPRQRPVMRGQVYHFKIERNDAKTVRYYVDTLLMATFLDAEPLMGSGHDHVGFNDWEAKVCFDNVKITPLP